jgi:hypothetical protein
MTMLLVRLNKPVRAKTKGVFGYDGKLLPSDAPVGRRVYMDAHAAVKAAVDGHVDMLSPMGLRLVDKARQEVAAKPAKPARRTTADTTRRTEEDAD